jgi:hypothetical protein
MLQVQVQQLRGKLAARGDAAGVDDAVDTGPGATPGPGLGSSARAGAAAGAGTGGSSAGTGAGEGADDEEDEGDGGSPHDGARSDEGAAGTPSLATPGQRCCGQELGMMMMVMLLLLLLLLQEASFGGAPLPVVHFHVSGVRCVLCRGEYSPCAKVSRCRP